jgi:hypothetical protein
MAKNGARGGGRRGAIRGRTQFLLPNGRYAKRDRRTGEILSIKADTRPYKGVVIERDAPVQDDHPAMTESARTERRFRSVFPH